MPPDDFEVLPDPCEITHNNQLVNVNTWSCTVDKPSNTFIIEAKLLDPYTYSALEDIEFSIDAIPMPSSTRPTGTFTLEFYDLINEVYRLVDTTSVTDKFRAIPGGLVNVNVVSKYGSTYTDDTMTFQLTLGHKILLNGFLTVKLPPELHFVDDAACIEFSDGID